VEYAGYEQETTLRLIASPDPSVQLGIWNVLVLPAGGQMIVRTLGRAVVRDIFAPTGPERLTVNERSIHFRIDAKEQLKIGLQAASVMGRAGYLRPLQNTRWTLVVRNFQVNPSGEYVDVPWDDPNDLGYVFQSYCDDGTSGDFGELEYHAPAVGGDTGLAFHTDRSQVWAFEGEQGRIWAVAERLLGQGVLPG